MIIIHYSCTDSYSGMTQYCHPYFIPPLILMFVSILYYTEETKGKNISPEKGTAEIATPTNAITPEVGGATTDTKGVEEEEESDEDIL